MAAPSYIPPGDSDLNLFLINFSTLITATPAAYGLLAADATAIAAQKTAYSAAFVLATDPSTRTPVTVAAKDTARRNAEAVVRPYAQRVASSLTVSDALKTGLGLNLHGTPPAPVPAPTVAPLLSLVSAAVGVHTIIGRNPINPTSKAMPVGSVGVQVERGAGATLAAATAALTFFDLRSKQPMSLSTAGQPSGTILAYRTRYFTRSGPAGSAQFGPWSEVISAAVL
jgi:hypothetical protein